MVVEYVPMEWNEGYDIVNDSEMFQLSVGGKLTEIE